MINSTILILVGMFIIMLGFLLLIIETMYNMPEINHEAHEKYERKVGGGGVIMIGPIPIVFGSDKRYALIAMLLAIVIMLIYLFLIRY